MNVHTLASTLSPRVLHLHEVFETRADVYMAMEILTEDLMDVVMQYGSEEYIHLLRRRGRSVSKLVYGVVIQPSLL